MRDKFGGLSKVGKYSRLTQSETITKWEVSPHDSKSNSRSYEE